MITKTIYKQYETEHESQEFKNLLAKLQVTGFSISRKNDWAYEVKRGKNVVGYINGNTSEFIEFIPVRCAVIREDNGSHYVLNKDGKVRSLSSYGIDERSDKTVIMAVKFNRDMLGNEIYTIKTIDKILALDIDLNCVYIKRSTY